MKYMKVNYFIVGRWHNGHKYGIQTRFEVSGYACKEYPEIAVRKAETGIWVIDSIETGFGMGASGETSDRAVKNYVENYKERFDNLGRNYLDDAKKIILSAPLDSDLDKWETINFSTVNGRKYDRIIRMAHNSNLIVKKADDAYYLHGGNINITGDPEKLIEIKKQIASWAASAETTEEHSAQVPAATAEEHSAQAPAATAEEHSAQAPTTTTEEHSAQAPATTTEEHSAQVPEATTEEHSAQVPGNSKIWIVPVPDSAGKYYHHTEKDNGKIFIGSQISGDGFKIYFNPSTMRTEITTAKKSFQDDAINAGFYKSYRGTYNKKLTWKAYRAAVKLAQKWTTAA